MIAVNIVDIQAQQLKQQQQQQHNIAHELGGQSGVDDFAIPRSNSFSNKIDLNGSAGSNGSSGGGGNGKIYHGFIAVLKDNFGFIETLQHDEEVFFHFSNYIGNPTTLELGNEVEYTLSKRNGSNAGNCLPAENVKILPRGTIPQPTVFDALYTGRVVRPLRCINPDQQDYSGLVECVNDAGETVSTHELGITSLTNKRDLLQAADQVVFKVDEAGRAAEVMAVRQKKQAYVISVKGLYGFLDFEVEEGKKLFFHMSEVQGNSGALFPNDCVEFSVVTNQVSMMTTFDFVSLQNIYWNIIFFHFAAYW